MSWIPHSNRIKVFLIIVGLLLLLWLMFLLGSVFLLVLLSIMLTFLLSPAVDTLETHGFKRVYAILAVYLLTAIVLFALLRTILPPVLSQVTSLEKTVAAPNFADRLKDIQFDLQQTFPFLKLGNLLDTLNRFIVDLTGKSLSILTSIGSAIMVLIIVPFVTFFFLKDGTQIIRNAVSLVPNRYFEMTLNVIHKIGIQLGRYIRSWLTEAAIVGSLAAIGLAILGVKYAVIIGIAAGVANLIPYLGSVVGAIPAILVSLVQIGNLNMFLPIVALFVVIRLTDDLLIGPFVISRGASMHPLTVVLLILVGAEMKGIIGMVLAIPLYTVLRVFAKEAYWGLESYAITKSSPKYQTQAPSKIQRSKIQT